MRVAAVLVELRSRFSRTAQETTTVDRLEEVLEDLLPVQARPPGLSL